MTRSDFDRIAETQGPTAALALATAMRVLWDPMRRTSGPSCAPFCCVCGERHFGGNHPNQEH